MTYSMLEIIFWVTQPYRLSYHHIIEFTKEFTLQPNITLELT